MACINDHRCNTCPHPCKTRNVEHQKWYSSQSVKNKELVTGKPYPECTVVWNAWTQDERTEAIEKSRFLKELLYKKSFISGLSKAQMLWRVRCLHR